MEEKPDYKTKDREEAHRLRAEGHTVTISPNGDEYWVHDISRDCFIATVVYGDRNAPEVGVLRAIRDEDLRNPIGKVLTDFYYSGPGKRLGRFLGEELSDLIPAIRMGLNALVRRKERQN